MKTLILLVALPCLTFALPIDWKGVIGVDTHRITDVRGTGDDCPTSPPSVDSYCMKKDNANAKFQTMLLRLQPTIIVNDSTSIKGEISTGVARGFFLGQDAENVDSGSYFSNNTGGSELLVNQMYAELYADTAIYRIGKFSKDFGLGAVINDGDQTWDRFFSAYSGFEANFRLGNLSFVPTFAKISTGNSATPGTPTPSGKYDVNESSIEISYDNDVSGVKGGVLYAKREGHSQNSLYADGFKHDVTLIDLYASKQWKKWSVAIEVPLLSGSIGRLYGASEDKNIKSNSIIFESAYTFNTKWSVNFNAGKIGGASGTGEFGGMYLNPNYQFSRIMFNYNRPAFQGNDENPFAGSINNATYLNLMTNYQTTNWLWSLSFSMANAEETAQSGKLYFNHLKKSYSTTVATKDQDSSLGSEMGISFKYEWNPQIHVGGYFSYYSVGDFYSFTNQDNLELENISASGLNLSVVF